MRLGPRLALTAALLATPACADATLLGSYVWAPEGRGDGGYSALWVGPDGADFVVLSDRGTWVRGTLARDAAGAVRAVGIADRGPLVPPAGRRRAPGEVDAEGIAYADGAFYVSYEGDHRIMRHPVLGDRPERIVQDLPFARMQENSGLEALAADADGRLYAIPERSGGPDDPFPVHVFADGAWSMPFTIPREGRFLVSGADVGPDGRLYVLERDFAYLGFRTRVRSFDLAGGDARTELATGIGTHDNLEGIAAWRDGAGRIRLTMVSDDNLRPMLQRTEFVDYVLE